MQEDGLARVVKEEYAVKAVNFTDCEAILTKEVGSADNVKEKFDILSEAIAPYKEVFIFDEGEDFYKVKVAETYLDDNGREKKDYSYYLLNATSFEQARKNIETALAGWTSDWTIEAVIKQKILEVFE